MKKRAARERGSFSVTVQGGQPLLHIPLSDPGDQLIVNIFTVSYNIGISCRPDRNVTIIPGVLNDRFINVTLLRIQAEKCPDLPMIPARQKGH